MILIFLDRYPFACNYLQVFSLISLLTNLLILDEFCLWPGNQVFQSSNIFASNDYCDLNEKMFICMKIGHFWVEMLCWFPLHKNMPTFHWYSPTVAEIYRETERNRKRGLKSFVCVSIGRCVESSGHTESEGYASTGLNIMYVRKYVVSIDIIKTCR